MKITELKTKQDLINFLSITEYDLNRIIHDRKSMYNTFYIPKKNGSKREINAPNKELKFFQRKIAKNLNELYIKMNGRIFSAHGFIEDRSILTNANNHLRRDIFNIDLTDFFSSINYSRINGFFYKRLGMELEASRILSLLVTLDNKLPQGSPSSPILTNFICYSMDKDLNLFSLERGLKYSRYADDITFSSSNNVYAKDDEKAPIFYKDGRLELNSKILNIIHSNDFDVNYNKLRISKNGSRKEVTGIVVNEKLNVSRKYTRDIRNRIHKLKIGLNRNLLKESDILKETKSLIASISYIRQVRGKEDLRSHKLSLSLNRLFSKPLIETDTPLDKEHYFYNRTFLVAPEERSTGTFDYTNGSGFILRYKNERYLVTCAHIFDDIDTRVFPKVSVGHNHVDTSFIPFRNFKICKVKDIAYTKINDDCLSKYDFIIESRTKTNYELGQKVFSAGFPDYDFSNKNTGYRININTVEIASNIIEKINGVNIMKVMPPFRKGASGGPVVDKQMNLVGMIAQGQSAETKAEGLDLNSGFIPVDNILKYINQTEIKNSSELNHNN